MDSGQIAFSTAAEPGHEIEQFQDSVLGRLIRGLRSQRFEEVLNVLAGDTPIPVGPQLAEHASGSGRSASRAA